MTFEELYNKIAQENHTLISEFSSKYLQREYSLQNEGYLTKNLIDMYIESKSVQKSVKILLNGISYYKSQAFIKFEERKEGYWVTSEIGTGYTTDARNVPVVYDIFYRGVKVYSNRENLVEDQYRESETRLCAFFGITAEITREARRHENGECCYYIINISNKTKNAKFEKLLHYFASKSEKRFGWIDKRLQFYRDRNAYTEIEGTRMTVSSYSIDKVLEDIIGITTKRIDRDEREAIHREIWFLYDECKKRLLPELKKQIPDDQKRFKEMLYGEFPKKVYSLLEREKGKEIINIILKHIK